METENGQGRGIQRNKKLMRNRKNICVFVAKSNSIDDGDVDDDDGNVGGGCAGCFAVV